jgi:hypothetical protein
MNERIYFINNIDIIQSKNQTKTSKFVLNFYKNAFI